MNINLDISYFGLKCKPNILTSLNTKKKAVYTSKVLAQQDWKFRNFKELMEIDDGLFSFRNQLFQTIRKYSENECDLREVKQILKTTKQVLKKASYYNITFNMSTYEDLFIGKYGLFDLYRLPTDMQICCLITQIQRLSKSYQENNRFSQKITNSFPYIFELQDVCVKEIVNILRELKENMYIPNSELFYKLVSKCGIKYNEELTLKENFQVMENRQKISVQQSQKVYYQFFVYKSCQNLEGLCRYLTFVKNIILDRKSGALITDHDIWVYVYDACLRLYCRNSEVRQNKWLEIDQILSQTFNDNQFSNFLMNAQLRDFTLESLNFYCKNLSKPEQQKLSKIVQNKTCSILNSSQPWKYAQDIVEHIDEDSSSSTKQKIFSQIINLINNLFVSQSLQETLDLIQIQIGLSFFIQSMCKHLLITQKIFNSQNIKLICKILKNTSRANQKKIKLLYHIFTEFIINSYEQSDELSSYLQMSQNEELIKDVFPQLIELFRYHGYNMPKEFYKLIFHSYIANNQFQNLSNKIWKGIAELYFIQSFEQTIDMEIFHTDNEAKQYIVDEIIEILKEFAINNGKQELQIAKIFQNFQELTEQKQNKLKNKNINSSLLAFKAFKDELIFNNLLLMSTFFGDQLSLSDISTFLNQLYSPLVNDLKWKSSENQPLTLLSFVSQQLPIDMLKTSYKFLKQGFSLNWQQLSNLSNKFWNLYLSNEQKQLKNKKVMALCEQQNFTFTQYKNLHSLRKLQLVLNMINCVFDKLNQQSQKSIKQLKIMYEWGIKYIRQIQPILYPILLQCMSNKFLLLANQLNQQNLQTFNLCSNNNISVLEVHLKEKYNIYQIFIDFNKIGGIIKHQKYDQIAEILYPTFQKDFPQKFNKKQNPLTLNQSLFVSEIVKIYALVENTCLQEVLNQQSLKKASQNHLKEDFYFIKSGLLFSNLKQMIQTETQKFNFKTMMNKPLLKRLISHLKLLLGKIYVPHLIKSFFTIQKQESMLNKFNLIKSVIQVLNVFDFSFEEHFASIMQEIEQNCQNEVKNTQKQVTNKSQQQKITLKTTIIISTLQMFIKCVLSNIKVRSYHIFKLIKLYLKYSNTQIQSINKVILFYIQLFYKQFLKSQKGEVYNIQIKEKCKFQEKKNLNKESRCIILKGDSSLNHSLEHSSFADRILTPLKRQKISLQELKVKKALKSGHSTPNTPKKSSQLKNKQNISSFIRSQFCQQKFSLSPQIQQQQKFDYSSIPIQIRGLLIQTHQLNIIQSSCTLSMFINLFARLNYSSLPVGVETILSNQNDKLVYIKYLIELTRKIQQNQNKPIQQGKEKSLQKSSQISITPRDMQILNIDVYGNLTSIVKGKVTEQIIIKFIQLSKTILKLKSLNESIINLPIKILNQRLFNINHLNSIKNFSNLKNYSESNNGFTQVNKITQLIESFENEPLAFDLALKSHLIKIVPYIQSNAHFCNLKYIIGNINNNKMGRKIMQTNFRLIQTILGGKKQARQFIQNYQHENKKGSSTSSFSSIKNKKLEQKIKEECTINIGSKAFQEINKVLKTFFKLFIQIQRTLGKSQQQKQTKLISQFYFQFRKICSILYYVPQMFSIVINQTYVNPENNKTTKFIDILFWSLQQGTLIIFSEFYLTALKLNSGFCEKIELIEVLNSLCANDGFDTSKQWKQLIDQTPSIMSHNLLFEIIIKIQLFNKVSTSNYLNLKLLRALNFTIKNSENYRFRFYKFMRISQQECEKYLKKIDDFILGALLSKLNTKQQYGNMVNSSNIQLSGESFISKMELLDICLQNHFSTTLIDYAKMKLDQKLKETFIASQYSLKCLKSFNNCQISTLKVLQQALEEEKSVSSNDQYAIEQDFVGSDTKKQDFSDHKIQQINVITNNKNTFSSPDFDHENIQTDRINQEQIQKQDQSKFSLSFEAFQIFKKEIQLTGSTESVKKLQQKSKTQLPTKPINLNVSFISLLSQSQLFSLKQVSQINPWFKYSSYSIQDSQKQINLLNQVCYKQLERNCQKLLGKQNFSFEEEGIMYLTNNINDMNSLQEGHSHIHNMNHNSSDSQVEITAFMIGQGNIQHSMSQTSQDCCIEETSFDQCQQQNVNLDEGIIIQSQSQNQIQNVQQLEDCNGNQDGIIQDEQDQNDQIIEDSQLNNQENQIKISIVEDSYPGQVNKGNKSSECEYERGRYEINQSEQEMEQKQEYIQEYQQGRGTDGSIQFTSSIKTLQNQDEYQENIQSLKQTEKITSQIQSQNHQIVQNSPPEQYHIFVNSQARQYHYTIDNLTSNESSRLNPSNEMNNCNSLVDAISAQSIFALSQQDNSPVTKQSMITLIQQYTLNPQLLKVILLKLKKISNSQLKKMYGLSNGQLRDEFQKEMRVRGIYVPTFGSMNSGHNQNYYQSAGSLFSISKLVNQSFQIDQSSFYSTNYKKCDKKIQQKQKVQQIPLISYRQWVSFVVVYLMKRKERQTEQKSEIGSKTFLQLKNLSELLLKLLLKKENLLSFLQVLLHILALKNFEEFNKFITSTGAQISCLIKTPKNQETFIKEITCYILNDFIAKLVLNRIGLPVILKGKWNYQTKKLIRYEAQCLFSDSNLDNNKSEDEPLLEVFLRRAIQLTYLNMAERKLSQNDENQKLQKYSVREFIKSLSDYFRTSMNFQSNNFPYYFIQDSVKLSHSTTNKEKFLSMHRASSNRKQSAFKNKSHSSEGLTLVLLNKMRQSYNLSFSSSINFNDMLREYEQIFFLMNYLDFETFSQFLEILIQLNKQLCQKILDKQLNLIKRFRKSANVQNMSKQKMAQLYWHMRKSSSKQSSIQGDQKQLQFFATIISNFASSTFNKFKESIFRFGYGKEENKKKEKISHLNKLLSNTSNENRFKQIKQQIFQLQKQYFVWKSHKTVEILKEDILPIIQKISSSFNGCLKKWEFFFDELYEIFGNQRQQKVILYKQCSEFYKIFLSFELLLQEEEKTLLRSMSSLKTKPSLESSKDMLGITGRRRSSLTLPARVSLSLPQTTFKSVIKKIAPKFCFFSQMIQSTCPQLQIHSKYSSLQSKLKLLHQPNKGGDLTIQVKRQSIWQDTLPYLTEQLKDKNVKIKIAQQLGLDYGGIRRQWITLIVKQLMNPNLGLFQLSANGLSFQPSCTSHLIPNHLYHFHKFGTLVGKALKQNWLLEINFTKSFLKHLLGYTLYVQDLEDIDPQTTKSLLWILNNQIGMDGDLGVDFTYEYTILGNKKSVQLVENARQIQVNDQNKKEYVKKMASYKMTELIREQAKAFISGVQKIVPYEVLKLFSYKQLGIYLAGMPTVDVEQMQKYSRYQGFSRQNESVKWFWQVLSSFTEEQKANFLFFLTGSYKVPYGGFKEHPISINKMPASIDYLPVAHTCFSVIDLPQYTSKQKLANLLDKAITQGKGFSVS